MRIQAIKWGLVSKPWMRAFTQQPPNRLDIFLPFQFHRKCGGWRLNLRLDSDPTWPEAGRGGLVLAALDETVGLFEQPQEGGLHLVGTAEDAELQRRLLTL